MWRRRLHDAHRAERAWEANTHRGVHTWRQRMHEHSYRASQPQTQPQLQLQTLAGHVGMSAVSYFQPRTVAAQPPRDPPLPLPRQQLPHPQSRVPKAAAAHPQAAQPQGQPTPLPTTPLPITLLPTLPHVASGGRAHLYAMLQAAPTERLPQARDRFAPSQMERPAAGSSDGGSGAGFGDATAGGVVPVLPPWVVWRDAAPARLREAAGRSVAGPPGRLRRCRLCPNLSELTARCPRRGLASDTAAIGTTAGRLGRTLVQKLQLPHSQARKLHPQPSLRLRRSQPQQPMRCRRLRRSCPLSRRRRIRPPRWSSLRRRCQQCRRASRQTSRRRGSPQTVRSLEMWHSDSAAAGCRLSQPLCRMRRRSRRRRWQQSLRACSSAQIARL